MFHKIRDSSCFRIKKQSGAEFSEMIFFDDEHRNIRDIETLGVLCVLVENGMNMNVLEDALKRYRKKHAKEF